MLRTPLNVLIGQFEAQLGGPLQLAFRYNVAPTQQIPVIRLHDGHRELTTMRWGFIPSWAKETKVGFSGINARGDTLAIEPAFRAAYKERRCLVLADGYVSSVTSTMASTARIGAAVEGREVMGVRGELVRKLFAGFDPQ